MNHSIIHRSSPLSRRRFLSALAFTAAGAVVSLMAMPAGSSPARAAEDDPAAARERQEREHRWYKERRERSRERQERFDRERLRRERLDAWQERREREFEERKRSLSPKPDE